MTATEYVVLVDEHDNDLGTAEKLYAHQHNLLHRAFSVFIFRNMPQRELLLQQRALAKYHSPGLWTNTCCSHPRQGEDLVAAAKRRLKEELGFSVPLTTVGKFIYNAHFPNGLSEHELDHILIGEVPATLTIEPNPEEVHATRWVTLEGLQQEISQHPEQFTPWLEGALQVLENA